MTRALRLLVLVVVVVVVVFGPPYKDLQRHNNNLSIEIYNSEKKHKNVNYQTENIYVRLSHWPRVTVQQFNISVIMMR